MYIRSIAINQTTRLNNPVLRGMYPDPSWMWDDSGHRVILVNSSFDLVPGLPIHASVDFAHWNHVVYAIDGQMARRLLIKYVEDSGGLYAPTIRRIHGRYTIACTVARLDIEAARKDGVDENTLDAVTASQGNFVITAESLEGPWLGPFWINGAEGIDPDIFEDQDGTVFWTQTRPAVNPQWEGQTEVWSQRLDLQTWSLIDSKDARGRFGKTVLWRGYGVDAVWSEGPHLYKIGDFVYLMTAEGGTSFDHSEMIMRASAPLGLWSRIEAYLSNAGEPDAVEVLVRDNERSVVGVSRRMFHANKKNPFLSHRHLGLDEGVQCIGHADLLLHPRVGWWATCLGVRETAGPNPGELLSYLGRETFVTPLSWEHDPANWKLEGQEKEFPDNSDDPGWPVIAFGIGKIPDSLDIDVDNQGAVTEVHVVGKHQVKSALSHGGDEFSVIDRGDINLATIRISEGIRLLRVDNDDFAVVVPRDNVIALRQDSRNSVMAQILSSEENAETVCIAQIDVLRNGQRKRLRSAVNLSDDCIGLWLHNNMLSCFTCDSCQLSDDKWNSDALLAVVRGYDKVKHVVAEMDGRFMSTEWAGGFVGCMIGARRQ